MPIPIECPACGADYRVPESLLDKTIRCKACEGAIRVREPEEADGEPEGEIEAPIPRKKRRKPQPSGTGNLPITVGIACAVLAIGGLALYAFTRDNSEKPVVADGGNPAAGGRPQPNNGQRITDPDQLIAGKYPAGPDKFVLDTPQKGRFNGQEFGYTIIDPKLVEEAEKRKGFGGRPARVLMTEKVFVVVASEGSVRDSQLSISWELKGGISVRAFGKDIPSGARICLAVGGQRVSNVVIVP